MLDLVKTVAKFLPGYLTSVVKLFTGPKTYIDQHNNSDEDFQDCLLFAALSFGIAISLTPQIFLPNGDIAKGLVTTFAFYLVGVFLGAAVTLTACRLAGGEATFRPAEK